MATYTGNLNLKKPSLDDDALITDINNNMDILDAAANGIEDAMAIVANGNTHAAITSGQFVYVRNHSTLAEGLYVASSNIAANATLSSSNLTADSKGGLNALSEQIGNIKTIFGFDVPCIQTKRGLNDNSTTFDSIFANWQCGILICNINGFGNNIIAFQFTGENTAAMSQILGNGGGIASITYANGKITVTAESPFRLNNVTIILT